MSSTRGLRFMCDASAIGQTNSPVVGPRFLAAMENADSFAGWIPRRVDFVLKCLEELGLTEHVEILKEKADMPTEMPNRLREAVAQAALKRALWHLYTLDEVNGRYLYKELNEAIRLEEESLSKWGPFIVALIYEGSHTNDETDDPELKNMALHCPSDMRCDESIVVHRGVAMPEANKDMYKQGKHFFWQTVVSTSLQPDVVSSFLYPDTAAFHFHITLPQRSPRFHAYRLKNVSAIPDEEEIALPPYTRFLTSKDPEVDSEGVINVHLQAVDQLITPRNLEEHLIWCDSSVFNTENLGLANEIFQQRLPGVEIYRPESNAGFFWNNWWAGGVGKRPASFGLFSTAAAALTFVEKVSVHPGALLKLILSGSISEEVLHVLQHFDTMCPCTVLILCDNKPRWEAVYKDTAGVKVTNEKSDVLAFARYGSRTATNREFTTDPAKLVEYWCDYGSKLRALKWYEEEVPNGIILGDKRGKGRYRQVDLPEDMLWCDFNRARNEYLPADAVHSSTLSD